MGSSGDSYDNALSNSNNVAVFAITRSAQTRHSTPYYHATISKNMAYAKNTLNASSARRIANFSDTISECAKIRYPRRSLELERANPITDFCHNIVAPNSFTMHPFAEINVTKDAFRCRT